MTKYSTIRGVFLWPWPGVSPTPYFERGEGPGEEVGSAGVQIAFCTFIRQLKPPLTRVQKVQITFFTFIGQFKPPVTRVPT